MTRRPTSTRLAPAAVVAAAALAVVGLGACGVPNDSEVRSLGTPPFGLLTTSSTSTASTVPADEGLRVTPYWVTADDEVTPGEPIGLPAGSGFQEVIDVLAKGPPVDASDGTTTTDRPGSDSAASPALRTYITEGLNPEGDEGHRAVGPLVVQAQDGRVDVLVDDRFRDESQATPTRFRLAIAQVVCTVTQFDNADEVRFFDSQGQLTLVNLEQRPIEVGTRANIGRCEPPPRTTTTTRRTSTTVPSTTTTTDEPGTGLTTTPPTSTPGTAAPR